MRADDNDDARASLRLFVGGAASGAVALAPRLTPAMEFDLPEAAAAHVKVRRLQPGDALRLFDGESGCDWPAVVRTITRAAVRVCVGEAPLAAPAHELPLEVALAFVMPANERVDALVEKASELGAAALWPLVSERSVLRLEGARAERRRAHWQAVAAAACEQCGRARVPRVHLPLPLAAWLAGFGWASGAPRGDQRRWLLSTAGDAPGLAQSAAVAEDGLRQPPAAPAAGVVFLSGPEGGFTEAEVEAAGAAGFAPASLGPATLRADTAPLAAMAWMAVTLAGATHAPDSPPRQEIGPA